MKKQNDDNFLDIEESDYEKKKKRPIMRLFFFIILIVIIAVIYARYIGTTGLFIKEYPIYSSKITEAYDGFKIVHFSDFHYGRTTGIDELKELVKEINKLKPDIVIFTGDFVDKDIEITDEELANIIEQLKKIDSTYGNYYVNGNHDLEYDKYNDMFDTANFTDLNDKYDVIYNKANEALFISGISVDKNIEFLDEALNDSNYVYKINIMHYPDYYDDIDKYSFDLVLAGHSHNGQVRVPFYGAIITPNYAKNYYKPYYKIDNTDFYISSGIGTSKYNFRLFNRPSFNFYILRQNKTNQ